MTTLLKKMSLGIINGVRGGFKDVTEPRHIGRIYGRATSCEAKDSATMGVSWKFVGDFKGINEDGEESRSPVCYLTDPSQSMLVEALKNADGGVDFAFDYFVVPNPTAVLGYEYKTKPVIEIKESAPLLALESQFKDAGPQKKQLQIAETKQEEKAVEQAAEKQLETEGAPADATANKKHK